MKKIAQIILPLVLFACTSKPENKVIPKGFQQITYQLDTLADNYVYKELKLTADVTFNANGEIVSAVQTRYSFEHQNGVTENVDKVYSPIDLLAKDVKLRFDQPLTDTLLSIADQNNNTETLFQYNKKSQLTFISLFYGFFQLHLDYDQYGQWTKVTNVLIDEISGHTTTEITERKLRYTDEAVKMARPTYLSVNDKDIFTKEKLTIVDYFVLMTKAGIIANDGGVGGFDIPNGFYEMEDEGTGAGVYMSQIALFKANDGRHILATNAYAAEPYAYFVHVSGEPPVFYLYENNHFTELTTLFPEVNTEIFFAQDFTGLTAEIETYFILPQKGLSIQYNLNHAQVAFCKDLDTSHPGYESFKETCESLSQLKRTTVDITFDKATGTFIVEP